MIDKLELHISQIQDEKTNLIAQQEEELQGVEDQVDKYRSQIISSIIAKYEIQIKIKQIEVEALTRAIKSIE